MQSGAREAIEAVMSGALRAACAYNGLVIDK
jgi:hypothetical protein